MSKNKEVSKWFQTPEEPKVVVPRQRIPATYIKRILDLKPKVKKAYVQRNLYAGSVIELEDSKKMHEALVEFWLPSTQELTFTHEFYTEIGSLIGDMYARRLHDNGVTYCTEDDHVEHYIFYEEYGLSGKIDAILDENLIRKLGGPAPKKGQEIPDEPAWFVNELKSTGQNNYAFWKTPEDLPIKYVNQFSLYANYIFEKGIAKHKEGMFTIISRDSPSNLKNIWLECNDQLVQRSFKVCDQFWKFVQDKEFPKAAADKSYNKLWIKKQIKNQPTRDWPILAKI